MPPAGEFQVVTVRELTRRPAEILDAVARGERVIVARHGRPIATLQPLTGPFFEPGAEEEILEQLTTAQRAILTDGVRLIDRLVASAGEARAGLDLHQAIRELITLGLAKRSDRGTVLTGRGHLIRERLLARVG
jgi:prevent-host-death family protein